VAAVGIPMNERLLVAHANSKGMAIHNAGADVIAKLADLAMGDDRSPLFGAGNAGVVALGGGPAVPPRR
jgi:hypothetical protein